MAYSRAGAPVHGPAVACAGPARRHRARPAPASRPAPNAEEGPRPAHRRVPPCATLATACIDGGALRHPRFRRFRHIGLRRQRHLEAHQLHAALFAKQHHAGLQIAMRHAAVVSERQATQDVDKIAPPFPESPGPRAAVARPACRHPWRCKARRASVRHARSPNTPARFGCFNREARRTASCQRCRDSASTGCARGNSIRPSRPLFGLRRSSTRQAMLRWLLPTSDSSLKWPSRRPGGASATTSRGRRTGLGKHQVTTRQGLSDWTAWPVPAMVRSAAQTRPCSPWDGQLNERLHRTGPAPTQLNVVSESSSFGGVMPRVSGHVLR